MLKAIRNTLANYAGGLASLAALLVFNVFYFRMAGEEAFGIISLLLTVSVMLPALDLGTGRTVGRIMADRLARQHDLAGLRNAVVTLHVANASVGLALGMGLALAAPAVATGWLRPQSLGTAEVAAAVVLIGVNISLIMPTNFLIACLNGMKRQVVSNVLLLAFTLLRGFAGLVALSSGEDPLQAFFVSQLLVQAADLLVSGGVVWRLMPPAAPWPRFDPAVLRQSWRFAASDGAANLIGACLAQGDKLLLSTLLPLSTYGAYALVSTVAFGIGRFTGPFSAAFLPHFVELTSLDRKRELRADYIAATQLLACVILPIAAVMIAFAPEIVAGVLGPDHPPGQLPLAFALLVAATILNNLMHLPHGVQLAAGNAITALRFAAINAVAYVALVVIATPRVGVVAPAASLLAIYAITIFFFTRVSHRMLDLSGSDWIGPAVLRPGLAAVAVAVLARLLLPPGIGTVPGIAWLVLATVAGSGAALAAAPGARGAIARFIAGREADIEQVPAEESGPSLPG